MNNIRTNYFLVIYLAVVFTLFNSACTSSTNSKKKINNNQNHYIYNPSSSVADIKKELTEDEKKDYDKFKKLGKDWSQGLHLEGPPELKYARLLEIVAWYEGYWDNEKGSYELPPSSDNNPMSN